MYKKVTLLNFLHCYLLKLLVQFAECCHSVGVVRLLFETSLQHYSKQVLFKIDSGISIGCAGCAVHKGPRHSGAPNRLGRNFFTPLNKQTIKLPEILK